MRCSPQGRLWRLQKLQHDINTHQYGLLTPVSEHQIMKVAEAVSRERAEYLDRGLIKERALQPSIDQEALRIVTRILTRLKSEIIRPAASDNLPRHVATNAALHAKVRRLMWARYRIELTDQVFQVALGKAVPILR